MNWFLVSLALGPIATLALVAVDKIDSPAAKREPPAAQASDSHLRHSS
jgi:hypothetical protein